MLNHKNKGLPLMFKYNKIHTFGLNIIVGITLLLITSFTNAAPIPREHLEVRKDMTAKEQQDYNKALAEVERAARTGGLTSTNSEDQRLIKSYTNNLKKLDAINKEVIAAQKKVDLATKKLAYAKKYPDIIDRDANRLIAEAIIARHPELRNIHLFRQWMITHRPEADAIAKPILANHDPFSTPHAKAAGF